MGAFEDLIGKQSGTLIAKKYLGDSKWECMCARCGNTVIISSYWFKKNQQLQRDGCRHSNAVHVGDTFGYLTIESKADDYIKPKSGQHERQWLCRCVCGRDKVILESNLKSSIVFLLENDLVVIL